MTVASNQFQNHNQLLRHGDAQLGHARRLPRLPAQLPRAAGRRPLPRRRRLGPGDEHDQLRPGTGEPHDAGRRRPARSRGRAPAGCGSTWSSTAAAARCTRRETRRRRRAGGRTSPTPPSRNAFGYINHTYEHPNLDCSTASFITTPDQPTTWPGRAPARPAGRRCRPRSSPASTRAWPTRGPATRARSTRRRSTTSTAGDRRRDPGRHLRLRDHRAVARRRDGGVRRRRGVARRRRRLGARELQRRLPRRRLRPLPPPGGRRTWARVGTLARARQRADRRRRRTRSC